MKKLISLTLLIAIFIASASLMKPTEASQILPIGFNMRGGTHYGYGDILPYAQASHVDANFAEMKKMGATIVRVFAPNKNISDDEAARRLDAFLTKAASYNISVIISLIDFYDTGYSPEGTDKFYTGNFQGILLLGDDFFKGGYKERYIPFITTVINANKSHSNIYAWEPGNELKNEVSAEHFIEFLKDTTSIIKALDPSHPVATGMIESAHTALSPEQLYEPLSSVDIITVHPYNGSRGGAADVDWANTHGKSAIVEEIGFSGTGNRTTDMRTELNFWRSKGVKAFIQWGFIAKGLDDNGDGDRDVGMDTIWHTDYNGLFALFKASATGTLVPTTPPPVIGAGALKVVQYLRDGAALGFINELLKESIQPVGYDNFLEMEQFRSDAKLEKTSIRAFGEEFPFFENDLRATGNDALTFYVDTIRDNAAIKKAGQFLYGWEPVPPGFAGENNLYSPIPRSLTWPVPGGILTQSYGCVPPFPDGTHYSTKCVNTTNLWLHNGIDIDASGCGDQVVAAAEGEIISAGSDSSFGNFIIIWHEGLGISTFYNHLSSIDVSVGVLVDKGASIAKAGNTGFVQGTICGGEHLHFMVVPAKVTSHYQRTAINPAPYF